jgi:putative two-component system response regulator
MPYLDGFKVMELLSQFEIDDYLPILVITGQDDRETKLTALDSGAKDFIAKPFDRVEAMNRIRNMLHVRLLHNQVKNSKLLLEKKVEERTSELTATRLEVIRRLSVAAEFCDNETGHHIIRIGKMCSLLAKEYGMDKRRQEMMLHAAPMHDVGKIGIPDSILKKPGKLDSEEWKIMKTHTIIGENILRGQEYDLLHCARVIALTHHEKWDGSGYPNGLMGTDIPIEGRICAIADVFDALTSNRPYKEAWPFERAREEILNSRGSHFDPQIVEIFDSIYSYMVNIKQAYQEECILMV